MPLKVNRFLKAAQQGNAEAMYQLGCIYMYGNVILSQFFVFSHPFRRL
jgi:hypothetical protein